MPDGSGVQKFYFCNCEKVFFALRREYRKTCSALKSTVLITGGGHKPR
ncbi:Uncharacterized protein dnm_085420 [Desulfonema magnum]|uniref:Uncharacterized protein n=1 Tax=Desulfonema magnum TaxID=45655 RepID=A0A975BVV8_9BACT|nr:Uncharacterized protein dnm_085420 [Desulfonema magnum]